MKTMWKRIVYIGVTLYVSYKFAMMVSINKDKKSGKYKKYYQLMCKWMKLDNASGLLSRYMRENNYHRIAIYGCGEMGNILYKQLQKTDCEVCYFLDCCSFSNPYSEKTIYRVGEKLPPVDVIVVTPYLEYEEIKKSLNTDTRTITIEEVINGAFQLQ